MREILCNRGRKDCSVKSLLLVTADVNCSRFLGLYQRKKGIHSEPTKERIDRWKANSSREEKVVFVSSAAERRRDHYAEVFFSSGR